MHQPCSTEKRKTENSNPSWITDKWMVHDNYPLPLITNIIDWLQGKTLFSKFDIWWGYNNIWIKEEDQWKAAFKTLFGLYKPRVMYFGLTNSPATFCGAMQKMSCNWLNKYPEEMGNYINDMVVTTKGNHQWHLHSKRGPKCVQSFGLSMPLYPTLHQHS